MAELLENFEVNRDPRWPILFKLIGASLALHITALASVIYIPAVSNAFNIASLLSKTGYVDKPYAKTEIGEVRMVGLGGGKFRYPDGYFALQADAGLLSQAGGPAVGAKIISQASRERREATPSPVPSPSPEPSPSPVPTPFPTTTEVAAAATPGTTPAATVTPAAIAPRDRQQAEEELNKIATENSVVRPNENEINTRPLKDWLVRANEMKAKGELDLSSRVEITIAARLTTDCKLGDPKIIQKSGDARLVSVAREMVSAIGDSGVLSFLRDPKKVKDPNELRCDEIPLQLTVKLDQTEISARVESQADSAERATEMAKGYSGLLGVAQLVKSGRDEEVLYKNTKVVSEGRQIVVSFSMPRDRASEMLKKQLPAT